MKARVFVIAGKSYFRKVQQLLSLFCLFALFLFSFCVG